MTKILTYETFVFENAIKNIEKDFEKKITELGLGSPSEMDDNMAMEFLYAVLQHDGDVKKVKKQDLKESMDFTLNESEIVEIIGEMGEIFGSASAIQWILQQVGVHCGKKNMNEVQKKLYEIMTWITAVSGVGQSLIRKAFEICAKNLGASGIGQKQVGRVGLGICLIILLACALAVFPAIGSSGSTTAVIVALVASISKLHEIAKIIKDVWHTYKNPSENDQKEFGDFFEIVAKKHHEKKINPAM